ncbi:MAG: M61 family metallopeptidase [Rhodospirillaceae bacterium]|nr:M61 family metallopeptidase [Rhodospirillaceae bacterium]
MSYSGHAQSDLPHNAPLPTVITAPQDIPYPGTMLLSVDATDVARRIITMKQTIPVKGGARVTLMYPEWLPGKHAPRGEIDKLAGLMITANGQRLEWVRDPVDTFAFHVDVPVGVTALDASFQFLAPTEGNQGRIIMTPEMMNLQWNSLALYPAGYYTRQIPVALTLKLPEGWQYGAALEKSGEKAGGSGNITTFKTVSFEELVDAPMFAGRHFERIELGDKSNPVFLNIVADREELLEAKPAHIAAHRALVTQAQKLFGSKHYKQYDFLLALTNQMGGIGLEHQQSSENGTIPNYLTDWDKTADARMLLPHEYTHSWNGKFRRGADAWTPTYSAPMRNSLLWVYEGQTQYWGAVLAARSGLMSQADALEALAMTAATFDVRVGREWKALQDTVNDPITIKRAPQAWRSWQRGEDYYQEGQLIWLDVDTLLREKSGGRKSLDDFAKLFFGVNDGSTTSVTYTFEDVVKALNTVQPHDWSTFLRTRLDGHGPAPLDGIARGGYKLTYVEKQGPYATNAEARDRVAGFTYSLGFAVNRDGRVVSVQWNGLAYEKGMTVGTQMIAVNNVTYDADKLKDAIKDAQKSGAPIEVLVRNGDRFSTVSFDYRGGLRYPKLERVGTAPASIDAIYAAKK